MRGFEDLVEELQRLRGGNGRCVSDGGIGGRPENKGCEKKKRGPLRTGRGVHFISIIISRIVERILI